MKISGKKFLKDSSTFFKFSEKIGLDFLNGIVSPLKFKKVVYEDRGYGDPALLPTRKDLYGVRVLQDQTSILTGKNIDVIGIFMH